jgi:hypothetical protein
MPPTDRFVISFAAEPPQEALPYGRWADTLSNHFLAACRELDTEGEEIGQVETEIRWFPDRTYCGRTYIPATARTSEGYELFGFVSFTEVSGGPSDFQAQADFTSELAENNPEWKLDLSDDVIGTWRGEQGKTAQMTLVWGLALIPGGHIVTAELANLAVDQCALLEERFTLVAPDDYRSDFLEIKLWSKRNDELARESLYVDEGDEEETDDADDKDGGPE